jgi:hypothetical protein
MSASLRTTDLMPMAAPEASPRSPMHLIPSGKDAIQGSQASTIYRLPSDRLRPFWLQLLINLQHGASIVTFLLVAAVLLVYTQTVNSQQRWSEDYKRLETLQRHERQLTTAGELLREQVVHYDNVATQGFQPLSLSHVIFVKPAPPSQPTVVPEPMPSPEPAISIPLAY